MHRKMVVPSKEGVYHGFYQFPWSKLEIFHVSCSKTTNDILHTKKEKNSCFKKGHKKLQ